MNLESLPTTGKGFRIKKYRPWLGWSVVTQTMDGDTSHKEKKRRFLKGKTYDEMPKVKKRYTNRETRVMAV